MYIFEINIPGAWLGYEDRDWTHQVEMLLRSMESQFYEANLTLNMFIQAASFGRAAPSKEQWEADAERQRQIREEVEKKYPDEFDPNTWDAVRLETDVLFKREQWGAGRLPREFEHNQIFIFARAFLYSIDSFEKFLKTLSETEGAPDALKDIHTKFLELFPDLRGVRNSAQHLEDRVRGLGVGTKPLDLKPIENGMVSAPNGALMLNCLNGSKYGNTMANGHYGEVDVSTASIQGLQEIFQEVLNLFKWTGPGRHLPSV